MSSLRITGGTVLCFDEERTILPGGEVGISDGRIDYVGPRRDGAAGEVIDATGQAVMPGLINAHTHVAMTLMRSYADDMSLHAWLEQRIWPVERHLLPSDVYWGTLLGCVEMIRAGVTTFNDMYWHAREATQAGLDSGLRTCPSGVLIGIVPDKQAMFERAVEFADECIARAHPRLHVRFGPHAPYTVPDDFMAQIIEAAGSRDVPIHTHLAETEKEVADCLAQHGERVMEHMQRIGLFDVAVNAAHCVHLSPAEIAILAERGVGVVTNHSSNLKLGAGVAPIPELLAAGVTIGLGTDGTASNNNLDVLEEVRLVALLHKGLRHDATVISAYEALEMATAGGARAMGFDDLGRLKPGYRADVICLDLSAPHLCPGHNVISDLAYAAQSSDVVTTIVQGEVVMRDRQVLSVDQAEVVAKAREAALGLVGRAG